MTQADKREMFRHSLAMLVANAHKHGMSWAKLHEELSAKTSEVWQQQHRAMLELFPENAKHPRKK